MKRKVLLFGLFQSLSFLASARSDSNGASMDCCIDADIASIVEYAETLEYSSTNAPLNANGERENLLPFGALKTDWERLRMLRDALPPDSVLKSKFKHLFRLLLIAHEQAIRFASSDTTKPQDNIESETTESIPIKADGNIEEIGTTRPITEQDTILNSTDRNQQVVATLKESSSTVSSVSPKYDKDSVDAVTKNSSQRTIVSGNEDETTVIFDIPERNTTIRLPKITGTSKPILEMSNTDKRLDDSFVSKTPHLITEKPQIDSTSGEATPVVNEENNWKSTPEPVTGSVAASHSSIPVATLLTETDNNSTEQKSEENVQIGSNTSLYVNVTSHGVSTESIVREGIKHFSSTSSTAVGISTKMGEDEGNTTLSYQPSTKTVSIAETSTNEYLSATTASNIVSSRSILLNSTSSENLGISTDSEKISSPAISTVTRPVERYPDREDYTSSTTVSSYETTKVSLPTSTTRKEELLGFTIKKNLSAGPVTTASPVVALEESEPSLSIRNITTAGIISEESSSSESTSHSTLKAEPSSERAGMPIGEYFSTPSSTNIYTDASPRLTAHSTENAPIATVRDNEGAKLTSLDYGIKFATSEKSTEEKHETSRSTLGSMISSGSSTVSGNTRPYIDGGSTTTSLQKETNSQRVGQRMNKNETSTYESTTERIDYRGPDNTETSSTVGLTRVFSISTVSTSTTNFVESSTTAITGNGTNWLEEKQSTIQINTTREEPVTQKIDLGIPYYIGTNSTLRVTPTFSSSTVTTGVTNFVDESSTTAINGNGTYLPEEKQSTNKVDTTRDEPVTKKIDLGIPHYISTNSTLRVTPTFSSSSVSTSTRINAEKKSTTVIVASETDPPEEKPPTNKIGTSEDKSVTEKINYRVPNDTGIAIEDNKNTTKSAAEPIFVKNPLHAGSSSNNHISRDFKHGSGKSETGINEQGSQEIILYETGGGAKLGNEWRPHIVREPPVGNNIRRFDKYPDLSARYGYQRVASSATTKPNVGSGKSAKWPFQDRTNVLRSRKRGSVNADVEKQFRSFYRQGKIDPSTKSRINENHNSKPMILCKNV